MSGNIKVFGATALSVGAAIGINHVTNGKVPAIILAGLVMGTLIYSAKKWGTVTPKKH